MTASARAGRRSPTTANDHGDRTGTIGFGEERRRIMDDHGRSRISLTDGMTVGLMALITVTVMTVTFVSPRDLPATLTGLAALVGSLVAMAKERRP
jgi:hypothetical protein